MFLPIRLLGAEMPFLRLIVLSCRVPSMVTPQAHANLQITER